MDKQGDGNESSPDLMELSAAEFFGSEVQKLQQQVSAVEGHKKRAYAPYHSIKSARTIRRHKQNKRELEAKGFLSVPEFFKLKAKNAGQQEDIEVDQSDRCKDKINNAEDMGNMCSKGAASMHGPEEEKEASEAEDTEIEMTSDACNAEGRARLIHMLIEEEEEGETEDEADKTGEVCSAKGGTMTIPTLSGRDSSDSELDLKPRWRPSRTVLYESEESSSSSCSGDTSLSDFDDLHNAGSKELEGVRCGNAPDDTATQQPMVGVTELLRNRPELQRVQGELSLKARGKGLDPVLRSRVVAMVGLLNLFLGGSLACTWKKASEVIAKSEGHGTSRAWSIRQWVVNFVRTRELPSHQHGKKWVSVLNDEALTQEIKASP